MDAAINLPKEERELLLSLTARSSDEQILAAITVVSQKYARNAEVAALLSRVLAGSGSRLDPRDDFVADVASSGGPSSLSTLIGPLLLRSAGALVPKLGVPGRPAGGIDCLAQIPHYRTILTLQDVSKVLHSGGYAHFLASGEIAPLDGRMFRLRQIHGAQSVPTLVTSSLLSKKLAVGVVYAGLDVRVAPHGNFGADWPTATINSRLFIQASQLLGIKGVPVLTDGRFPYQPYIGRREALVALREIFSGKLSGWLDLHFQSCKLLVQACVPQDQRLRLSAVTGAELRSHFDQNLSSQGAEYEAFEQIVEETKVLHTHTIVASNGGFVHFPLEDLRNVLVQWQQQLVSANYPFPDPVGIILLQRPGNWVPKGEPLATFRTPQELKLDVAETLQRLISTPSERPVSSELEAVAAE